MDSGQFEMLLELESGQQREYIEKLSPEERTELTHEWNKAVNDVIWDEAVRDIADSWDSIIGAGSSIDCGEEFVDDWNDAVRRLADSGDCVLDWWR